jgi:hypothetical protein
MRHLLLLISLFAFYGLHAQKVSGYWYGQANVEMDGIQNNYLTELIIAQKGNKIRGFFGYYFKDVYESFLVKGTYDPQSREIIIRNIPIIYFNTNSTAASVDCITSFYGKLMVSKVKSSLTGYFYRDKKYEYTCPDLRVSYTLYTEANIEDSVFKEMAFTKTYWKPQPNTILLTSKDSGGAVKNDAVAKSVPLQATIAKVSSGDSASETMANRATLPSTIAPVVVKPMMREDIVKINEDFKKRKALVGKELEVSSDSIRLSFYDNAEVDGDSISVFVNDKLVLAHQELTEKAFNLYIKLDSLKEFNEVSMFAENLGKYPPNTALMVVSDGETRYEVFLSSDFKGNATVRFKRKKSQ